MTIIVLGNAHSGKHTFIQALGGIRVSSYISEYEISQYFITNDYYVGETVILLREVSIRGLEEISQIPDITHVFLITFPNTSPTWIVNLLQNYPTLCAAFSIIINKRDIIDYHKKHYLVRSITSNAYKIKLDAFLTRYNKIKAELKAKNIPFYNISSIGMSTDEIYNILDDVLFPNKHSHFRRADTCDD